MEQARTCDEVVRLPENIRTQRFAETHYDFHSLVAKLSGSPLLREAMERLNLRNLLMTNAVRVWGKGIDQEGGPHQALVDAMFDADETKALQAVVAHIRRGLDCELEAL
jgi:DNA-binding GntR family transcriptional regulator